MGEFCNVLIFADPRFPGGTSTAIAAEIAALAREGIVPGLCPVLSPVPGGWREDHPAISAALAEGRVRLMEADGQVRCNIAIVHHPALFARMPARHLDIEAQKVLLVLHHPPLDGFGLTAYDLAAVVANISEAMGADVQIAPVGPAVRRQVEALALPCAVLPFDWHNLADPEAWPLRQARPDNRGIVIGRHSRPEPQKYPATLEAALEVYPDAPPYEARMLGARREVLEARLGEVPAGWRLLAFDPDGARAFLEQLDYYVYYHGPEWVEAFGINIVEAILTGVPAILPPGFEPLFGPAALYAEPGEVLGLIDRLESASEDYERQVARARTSVAERFGLHRHVPRLDRVLPRWREGTAGKPARPAAKRRILMVTSNGIGLGHLTRCLAIADRLGNSVETAFLTLSQAFSVAEERGYLTQFVPFHRLTGVDPAQWNTAFAEEVSDFILFFRPDLLVFDGNVPYDGLIKAMDRHPEVKRVWIRRGLWGKGNGNGLERASAFDTVLEPGEISARFDTGPTAAHRDGTFRTPPILLVRPEGRLSREQARAAIGLPPDATVVGLMLGAGRNYDFAVVREAVMRRLATADVTIVDTVSPIAADPGAPCPENAIRFSSYPLYPYTTAFDFVVCGAGYNTFHEVILGGVPALFVPNEAPEMDRQILRAAHARAAGWGEVLRRSALVDTGRVLARMLDADARAQMRRRMARVTAEDGAAVAARFIARRALDLRTVSELGS